MKTTNQTRTKLEDDLYLSVAPYLPESELKPFREKISETVDRAIAECYRNPHQQLLAKALRKKGTDQFYYYDGDEWGVDTIPVYFEGDFKEVEEELDDAELVNIEIHVQEGGEG